MPDGGFSLAVIPLSLGISGLIFLGIALFLNHRFSYKGGIKTTGILTCFRKLDNEHAAGAIRTAAGTGSYKDYDNNVINSKPVFRFIAEGQSVECYSEWSAADLDKKDIGRSFPIRYFPTGKGSYNVILEGVQYERQRNTGRKIIFWIFAGLGIGLVALAVFITLLYYMAAN